MQKILVKKIKRSLLTIKYYQTVIFNYCGIEKSRDEFPNKPTSFLERTALNTKKFRCTAKALNNLFDSKKNNCDFKLINAREQRDANSKNLTILRFLIAIISKILCNDVLLIARIRRILFKSTNKRKYFLFTVFKKNSSIPVRAIPNATITRKKKLKAIYNSSEFKSIPQYPKIVTIKNKMENFTKKKLSLKVNINLFYN